jgi:hypothetical protein
MPDLERLNALAGDALRDLGHTDLADQLAARNGSAEPQPEPPPVLVEDPAGGSDDTSEGEKFVAQLQAALGKNTTSIPGLLEL